MPDTPHGVFRQVGPTQTSGRVVEGEPQAPSQKIAHFPGWNVFWSLREESIPSCITAEPFFSNFLSNWPSQTHSICAKRGHCTFPPSPPSTLQTSNAARLNSGGCHRITRVLCGCASVVGPRWLANVLREVPDSAQ